MYDLTSEVTPITARQYGDTCIHIDIQSQDGDSVNSLVNGDICPTTETEQLELKPMVIETESARQTVHQETSHSSGTAPQRKDLDPLKSVSDSEVLCSGADLQKAERGTEIGAEEMEMRGLSLSSSDEDMPLYSRSPETASVHDRAVGDTEEGETLDLDNEREHKPTFGYQQL